MLCIHSRCSIANPSPIPAILLQFSRLGVRILRPQSFCSQKDWGTRKSKSHDKRKRKNNELTKSERNPCHCQSLKSKNKTLHLLECWSNFFWLWIWKIVVVSGSDFAGVGSPKCTITRTAKGTDSSTETTPESCKLTKSWIIRVLRNQKTIRQLEMSFFFTNPGEIFKKSHHHPPCQNPHRKAPRRLFFKSSRSLPWSINEGRSWSDTTYGGLPGYHPKRLVTGSWSKNQPFKSGLICWFQIFKVPKHFENGNCKSHSEKTKPLHLQPLVALGTLPAGTLAGLIALPENQIHVIHVWMSWLPKGLHWLFKGLSPLTNSYHTSRKDTTEELAPNRVHKGQPLLFHAGRWPAAMQVTLGFNFSPWRCWPSRWLQRTGVPSKAYNGGHFC